MAEVRSIFVIDDDADLREAVAEVLGDAGFEVRQACDGANALQQLDRGWRPTLILLDAMMPKRDGFDVCQTIRANPRWTSVRVIMLTAKGRDIEREKGMAMGADDYITKPFSTKEVVAQVEKVLGPAEGSRNE